MSVLEVGIVIPDTVHDLLTAAGDDPHELRVRNRQTSGWLGARTVAEGRTTLRSLPFGQSLRARVSCPVTEMGRPNRCHVYIDSMEVWEGPYDWKLPRMWPGDILDLKLNLVLYPA